MKRLTLVRHAKSSWKDESLADRDRRIAMQEQAITELRGMLAITRRTP